MKINTKKLLTYLLVIIVFVIGIGILVFLAGRSSSENERTGTTVKKGVSMSPLSYGDSDFKNFLSRTSDFGTYLAWYGKLDELQKDNFGGAGVTYSLSQQYKYKPVIALQVYDSQTKKLYPNLNLEILKKFVEKYKPEYLGLGIEINTLYENNPEDFNQFVTFYNSAYKLVKAASPQTKVFTIFQLEKLKGFKGGLFGGVNDESKNEYSLLNMFESDAVGLTTYPGLIYKDPSDIPVDYYSKLNDLTDKQIIFTEIGWASSSTIPDWGNTEQKQSDFITKFFELTKPLKPELYIWSFAYDQQTLEPFSSMGLIDRNGKEKLGFKIWKEVNN